MTSKRGELCAREADSKMATRRKKMGKGMVRDGSGSNQIRSGN